MKHPDFRKKRVLFESYSSPIRVLFVFYASLLRPCFMVTDYSNVKIQNKMRYKTPRFPQIASTTRVLRKYYDYMQVIQMLKFKQNKEIYE